MNRMFQPGALWRRLAAAGATTALAALCAGGAQAQPTFSLTDLGELPGGGNRSWAQGINNLGHVVGGSLISTSTYGYRPYVWTPEHGMKQLTGFGEGAGALEINDDDVIGGTTGCLGGCPNVINYYGWRWQGNVATGAGTTTSLGSISQPWGLNDSGQFVGPNIPATGAYQSILATPNGASPPVFTYTNLGHLNGSTNASFAHAVNEAGQVVGWATSSLGTQPYIWTAATGMQALTPTALGAARGINDLGQVVGYLSTAGNTFASAFLWSAADGLVTLGAVDWEPEGINNLGWVVGCKSTGDCGNNRNGTVGYLWTPDSGLNDLLSLIDPADPLLAGLTINNVPGINDLGQIVVNATRGGVQHAYLLTPTSPVPEPARSAMLLLGVLMLASLRLRRRHLAALAALSATVAAQAQDIARVAPAPASIQAPELAASIGRVHSLLVKDGRLVVGATRGVAVIDAEGRLVWSTPLPEADARAVDVEGGQVAYTSYVINGFERSGGLTSALMWGNPSLRLDIASAELGLIGADGKALWSTKSAEVSALSPPALGKGAVAVQGAKALRLYERNGGMPVGDEVSMFTNWLGISAGWATRLPVARPLWVGDELFAAHQSWFKKVSAGGEEIVATKSLGKNFTMLLAGPLMCGGKVMLAEAAYPEGNIFTGKKARVYAAGAKGEPLWYAQTEDDEMGVPDLACNDDLIFAVSNAQIVAFSHDGKPQWTYASKGGVLVPGTHRGMLKAGTLPIAHQIAAGRQVLAVGPYLYVTSRAERNWKGKADVITVFDAKSGKIVEQIDPQTMIVDMAVFGSDLALATSEGLRFVGLKR